MVFKGRILFRVQRGILHKRYTGTQPTHQTLAPGDTWPLASAVAVFVPVGFPPVPGPIFPLLILDGSPLGHDCFFHPAPDPDSCTKSSTHVPEMVPVDMVQVEEDEASHPPVQASTSSFPGKVVTGPSNLLPPGDFRAYQGLERVTTNLGLEVEELKESAHSLVDFLAVAASPRAAPPVNEAVSVPVRAQWQILSSLPPNSKRAGKKVLSQPVGLCTCTYMHAHTLVSLVVSAANERERWPVECYLQK